MSDQEILDYNQRCVEFLGYKHYPKVSPNDKVKEEHSKFRYFKPFREEESQNGEIIFINNLKFHSDWNCIMEILNKVASLDYGWKITSKYVNIYSHSGDPKGKFDCKFSINCPENVVLDTIKTINQFLIWYKENNK